MNNDFDWKSVVMHVVMNEMVSKLYNVIKKNVIDLRRATYGTGNYRMLPDFCTRFVVSVERYKFIFLKRYITSWHAILLKCVCGCQLNTDGLLSVFVQFYRKLLYVYELFSVSLHFVTSSRAIVLS